MSSEEQSKQFGRELMFRAWDRVSQEMIGDVLHLDNQDVNNFGKVLKDSSKTVMQYTGLKDKNGQEVYEGDIVERTGGHRGTIKYSIPEASFLIDFGGQNDFISEYYPPDDFEVIGNIFEHPHLIEQGGQANE